MVKEIFRVSFKLVLYFIVLFVVSLLVFTQLFIGLNCSGNQQIGFSFQSSNNSSNSLELQAEIVPETFLFVGVLSKGQYHARRIGCRLGWVGQANSREDVVVKFLLTEAENDEIVKKEQSEFKDVVLIPEDYSYSGFVGYRDIFVKVVYMFDYALKNQNFKFIMKTDDDAFINVPGLVKTLKEYCETPECAEDRLYIGHMFTRAQVITNPKHKWFDGEYINHTGLHEYPPYAQGGGYLLTKTLVEEIMYLYSKKALIETPIEDANIGFWLTAIRHTRIDMPTFWTWGDDCCGKKRPANIDSINSYNDWKGIVKRQNMPPAGVLCPLKIQKQVLVLHKITNPQLMKVMGQLFDACKYVNGFQQQCISEDYKQIVCKQVDIWDLCIIDETYSKFCQQLKTRRHDYLQRFTDEQLNYLERPFNYSDVERVFEIFQQQVLSRIQSHNQNQNQQQQQQQSAADFSTQVKSQESIQSMIVQMMYSLQQLNYTVQQENNQNFSQLGPTLEAIQHQLVSLPGQPSDEKYLQQQEQQNNQDQQG